MSSGKLTELLARARWSARVDEVPAAAWDALATPGGFYSSSVWLRCPRRGYGQPTSPSDGPIAAAVVHTAPRAGVFPPLSEIASELLAAHGQSVTVDPCPLTLAGPVRGYASRLLVGSNLDASDRRDAVRAILDERWLVRACLRIRRLLFARAAVVRGLPRLLSQSPRAGIVRDIKSFAKAGLTVVERPVEEVVDRAVALFVEPRPSNGSVPDPSLLRGIMLQLAPHTKLCCAQSGSDIVGVAWAIHYQRRYFMRAVGFEERADLRSAAVYFNTLFYHPLRVAAQEGIEAILAGPPHCRAGRQRQGWSRREPLAAVAHRSIAQSPITLPVFRSSAAKSDVVPCEPRRNPKQCAQMYCHRAAHVAIHAVDEIKQRHRKRPLAERAKRTALPLVPRHRECDCVHAAARLALCRVGFG